MRYTALARVSVPLTERIWNVIRYTRVQQPSSASSRPRPLDVIDSPRVCPPHEPANVARLAGGGVRFDAPGPLAVADRRHPKTVSRTLWLGVDFWSQVTTTLRMSLPPYNQASVFNEA